MISVKLELILNKNGITFLNFWDSLKGKDVTCEVIDGKLICDDKEISLQEFIDRVHEQRKEHHETLG